MQEFVDGCWRFANCNSQKEFFDKYNPIYSLLHFTTPCLFLLAYDDPISIIEKWVGDKPLSRIWGVREIKNKN